MEAVVEHFRTRTAPAYLFTVDDMKNFQDEKVLEEAEEVMNHKIYGYQFPGETSGILILRQILPGIIEWSWSLFRHIYWQPLARAYVMTGDERYTKDFFTR